MSTVFATILVFASLLLPIFGYYVYQPILFGSRTELKITNNKHSNPLQYHVTVNNHFNEQKKLLVQREKSLKNSLNEKYWKLWQKFDKSSLSNDVVKTIEVKKRATKLNKQKRYKRQVENDIAVSSGKRGDFDVLKLVNLASNESNVDDRFSKFTDTNATMEHQASFVVEIASNALKEFMSKMQPQLESSFKKHVLKHFYGNDSDRFYNETKKGFKEGYLGILKFLDRPVNSFSEFNKWKATRCYKSEPWYTVIPRSLNKTTLRKERNVQSTIDVTETSKHTEITDKIITRLATQFSKPTQILEATMLSRLPMEPFQSLIPPLQTMPSNDLFNRSSAATLQSPMSPIETTSQVQLMHSMVSSIKSLFSKDELERTLSLLKPMAQPVQPIMRPVQSIAQAIQPMVHLVQPIQPIAQSVQPIAQPVNQNMMGPIQSLVAPNQIVQPVQSMVQSVKPIVGRSVLPPVQSLLQTVQPMAQPVLPVVQPMQPVIRSLGPTQPMQQIATITPLYFYYPIMPMFSHTTERTTTEFFGIKLGKQIVKYISGFRLPKIPKIILPGQEPYKKKTKIKIPGDESHINMKKTTSGSILNSGTILNSGNISTRGTITTNRIISITETTSTSKATSTRGKIIIKIFQKEPEKIPDTTETIKAKEFVNTKSNEIPEPIPQRDLNSRGINIYDFIAKPTFQNNPKSILPPTRETLKIVHPEMTVKRPMFLGPQRITFSIVYKTTENRKKMKRVVRCDYCYPE